MATVLYLHSSVRFLGAVLFLVAALAAPVARATDSPPAAVAIALERGEYSLAATRWREAAGRSRDRADFAAAARFSYDFSQYQVLALIGGDWLRQDPQSEEAHRFLAVSTLELDRREVARRELEWLLVHAYPTVSDGFESLGRSLAELHNRAGVAAVMRSVSLRHADSGEGHLQAGRLALAAGDAGHAIAEARSARELGRRRLGRSLESRASVLAGDCVHGLALAAALGTDIKDADRLTEAWLLMACDRAAEAESIFHELAQHSTARADAIEALAGRELDSHRNEAAARHYTELGNLGGRDAAQFGLAMLAERSGDPDRAIALYANITAGSRAADAQLRAYRLRIEGEGLDMADRVLDDFVLTNPALRREMAVGRVLVLADRALWDAAISLAHRTEQAYPDADEIVRVHAEVLVRAGRIGEAIALLERLYALRPEDPAAQNALGYTLADVGRDLRRAERLLSAACAQGPDNAAYLDSLGWLRYRQRDYQQARTQLERAYRLQPDSEIGAHYGAVLYAAGDAEAATRFLRSALERAPGDRHLLAVLNAHGGAAP
ncbi:MAG: tetratricopeptide repeat protein [Pseudomonadota bacterium]|jgi:tetratricopeptide (TPR) repeat protein